MKRVTLLITYILFTSVSAIANKETEPDKKRGNAVVHFYRPSRIIGFGWSFKVRMNEREPTKLKNGKYFTIQLKPGDTQFRLKKSLIELNLEPGKHYYLRASLIRNMFLGKPEIVEVTEQQAKKEIASL